MLINSLACVGPDQAWILSECHVDGGRRSSTGEERKRKVVTLADLRREYADELDRIAAIENDQFGIMEVDNGGEDGDVMMDIS